MATNGDDARPRNGEEVDDAEQRSAAGNWLGRWVMMLAITAFLIVYVAQLWRGAGFTYTVLVASGAMGIAGIGGMIVRRMLLQTAAQDRAEDILQQMREWQEEHADEPDDEEED